MAAYLRLNEVDAFLLESVEKGSRLADIPLLGFNR